MGKTNKNKNKKRKKATNKKTLQIPKEPPNQVADVCKKSEGGEKDCRDLTTMLKPAGVKKSIKPNKKNAPAKKCKQTRISKDGKCLISDWTSADDEEPEKQTGEVEVRRSSKEQKNKIKDLLEVERISRSVAPEGAEPGFTKVVHESTAKKKSKVTTKRADSSNKEKPEVAKSD